jgi:hypothetical protein
MKKLLILLFTLSYINATNLLTYNIYERSDRIDLMLSFDSPYEGRLTQKRGENITILTLNDLTYDKLIEKNINSNILQALSIEPIKDSLQVVLKSQKNIAVIASKTIDGFGLRIRAKPINITNKTNSSSANERIQNTTTPISTKQSEDLIDARYLSVIALLTVMLIFMFWIKRKVNNKTAQLKNNKSWLFKKDTQNALNTEVNVLHQKQIDNTNSVVLLEFENRKYLVMTGSSNLLLEKFSQGDIKDNSEFEKAFENNRKKLDEYLRIQKEEPYQDDYRSKLERY